MKKYMGLLWILFMILNLTGCGEASGNANGKSLLEEASIHNISKIVFYDGRSSKYNPPITVEDPNKIKEFLQLLQSCKVQKPNSAEPSTGWIHDAVLYDRESKVADITFGVNRITLNKSDTYDVIGGNITKDKIDAFLVSVYPSYKK